MSLITELSDMQSCFEQQQTAFKDNPYPSYKSRRAKLKALKAQLLHNKHAITEAINADFGNRHKSESTLLDIVSSLNQVKYSLEHLKKWMRPQNRNIGLLLFPAKAEVHYQPKGVVAVIAPWNYPLFLTIGPLAAALAAGNRVMIKMSEFTPNTNKAVARVLGEIFSQDEVAVVEGEVDISTAFSSLRFDHIFFTGSTAVGKAVMSAAAKNLTPVTLELGGKCPTVLADDYSVTRFARNMIMGKTLNGSQTCVAPDTLYVPESKLETVVTALRNEYQRMYPEDSLARDCTSLIHDRRWARINELLENARDNGARIEPLAEGDYSATRQLPLTLVINSTDDMLINQEEIFGPLLPVMTYTNVDDVIKTIQHKERPLALYLFSNKVNLQRKFLYLTHSGGVCLNDCAFHVGVDDLPFGGIGQSGMGSCHSDAGFKTFSHEKSVMIRGLINLSPMFGPPYGKSLHRLFERLFVR